MATTTASPRCRNRGCGSGRRSRDRGTRDSGTTARTTSRDHQLLRARFAHLAPVLHRASRPKRLLQPVQTLVRLRLLLPAAVRLRVRMQARVQVQVQHPAELRGQTAGLRRGQHDGLRQTKCGQLLRRRRLERLPTTEQLLPIAATTTGRCWTGSGGRGRPGGQLSNFKTFFLNNATFSIFNRCSSKCSAIFTIINVSVTYWMNSIYYQEWLRYERESPVCIRFFLCPLNRNKL